MTEPTILRMKPYIQPFERLLAVQELESLIGTDSAMLRPEHDYAIRGEAALEAARSLAYWEAIGEEYTPQVRREAASVIARNGVALSELPFLQPSQIDAKAPRSRCLRYGPHGIHEYRGKFFPQLVKALINISGVRDGTVLDPMCGSGTTLVEAAAAGSLEAVATALALVHGVVPPTAQHDHTDPEVPFDCVPRVAREAALGHAISNSFGFGGQNVTLLFRACP